jgi:hypothetical protein
MRYSWGREHAEAWTMLFNLDSSDGAARVTQGEKA